MDKPVSHQDIESPKGEELFHQGWKAFSNRDYPSARDAFENAVNLDTSNADYVYCLGLAEKFLREQEKSIKSFKKVIDLTYTIDNRTRATIVRRLAQAHINHLTRGDWDLEKDVWKKTS